jgi:predicted GIY-YIG superfamily endonuclease
MPGGRKACCAYLMGSRLGTPYIGRTGNLHQRVFERKFHRTEGFTDRYDAERLLCRESFDELARTGDQVFG